MNWSALSGQEVSKRMSCNTFEIADAIRLAAVGKVHGMGDNQIVARSREHLVWTGDAAAQL